MEKGTRSREEQEMTFTNQLWRGSRRRAASLAVFGFAAAMLSAACQQGSSGPFSSLSVTPSSLAVHSESDQFYKASISPTPVVAGTTNVTFTVALTNCSSATCSSDYYSGSGHSIKLVHVNVPSAFTNITGLSVTVSNGGTWDVPVLDGNTIKTDKGTGSDSLAPGDSVQITFNADVPCDPGTYEFQTAAFNDADNPVSPYILYPVTSPVSYPTVTVSSGSCSIDEECPAAPAIAAHYLHDHGVRPGTSTYNNIVAAVAAHMGPETDFDEFHKCDAGYAGAVEDFVQDLIDQLP
jgi:hypothetical protein